MSRVRWTEQAVGDVQAIRRFIERDSPRYGHIVAERLVEATLRLETFPESGRIVPDLETGGRSGVDRWGIPHRLPAARRRRGSSVFRSSRLFPRDLKGL